MNDKIKFLEGGNMGVQEGKKVWAKEGGERDS